MSRRISLELPLPHLAGAVDASTGPLAVDGCRRRGAMVLSTRGRRMPIVADLPCPGLMQHRAERSRSPRGPRATAGRGASFLLVVLRNSRKCRDNNRSTPDSRAAPVPRLRRPHGATCFLPMPVSCGLARQMSSCFHLRPAMGPWICLSLFPKGVLRHQTSMTGLCDHGVARTVPPWDWTL